VLVNRFGLKRSEQPRGCLLEHDKAAGVTIGVRLSVPWSSVLPDESAGRDPASRRRVLRRFVPPQVCIFLSFFFLVRCSRVRIIDHCLLPWTQDTSTIRIHEKTKAPCILWFLNSLIRSACSWSSGLVRTVSRGV
jgi:hypothetical protein